jgi:hypothetical protein
MLSIPLHLFIFLSFYSIASLLIEPDPLDGKAPLFPETNPKSVPFPNLLPLALLLLLLCFPINFEIMWCWQENLLIKKVWVFIDELMMCVMCGFHFGILRQMNRDGIDAMLMKN